MTDHNPPLGIWEGVAPEPAHQEGDTQPNTTEYDCGYDLDTGNCLWAYPDGCPTCPHWQAIGDVSR